MNEFSYVIAWVYLTTFLIAVIIQVLQEKKTDD